MSVHQLYLGMTLGEYLANIANPLKSKKEQVEACLEELRHTRLPSASVAETGRRQSLTGMLMSWAKADKKGASAAKGYLQALGAPTVLETLSHLQRFEDSSRGSKTCYWNIETTLCLAREAKLAIMPVRQLADALRETIPYVHPVVAAIANSRPRISA